MSSFNRLQSYTMVGSRPPSAAPLPALAAAAACGTPMDAPRLQGRGSSASRSHSSSAVRGTASAFGDRGWLRRAAVSGSHFQQAPPLSTRRHCAAQASASLPAADEGAKEQPGV